MDFAQFVSNTSLSATGHARRLEYESIVNQSTTTSRLSPSIHTKPHPPSCRRPVQLPTIPFNANTFFCAAAADDLPTLRSIRLDAARRNDVNTLDAFGWSALMMAACAGASHSVTHLLQQPHIDLAVCDTRGRCALSLAAAAQHRGIVTQLREHLAKRLAAQTTATAKIKQESIVISDSDSDDNDNNNATAPPATFFCPPCDRTFAHANTTRAQHDASILHRFNIRDQLPRLAKRYHLPDSNRGFRLMLKQGWDREAGLGPTGDGPSFPMKTALRDGRSGLGVPQPRGASRITHFAAHDVAAVQRIGGATVAPKPVAVQTKRRVRAEATRRHREERRLRQALS